MSDGNLYFEPVNMGQALGVLADVVGNYISAAHTSALDDPKRSAQLNLTVFLHTLLMRSKYKTETAELLDIISQGLREAAEQEKPQDDSARPAVTDS